MSPNVKSPCNFLVLTLTLFRKQLSKIDLIPTEVTRPVKPPNYKRFKLAHASDEQHTGREKRNISVVGKLARYYPNALNSQNAVVNVRQMRHENLRRKQLSDAPRK